MLKSPILHPSHYDMLTPDRQLTELVRLLQERGYIFSADPEPITDALRQMPGSVEARLNRRSEMIDSDHKLRDRLARIRSSGQGLLWAATLGWLVLGFTGTFTLMQQSGLNFFFVLASVLGLNSVMFVVWLALMLMPHKKAGGLFGQPGWWVRGKDEVSQAVQRLYGEEWNRAATAWLLSKTSHRFWLATLSGMLAAAVLLLSVRQYTFNWESTLLSDASFVQAVQLLAWLPAKLGFPVPDADAVISSRMANDASVARQWGGLLIGSIICYGMLPRFAAWLACHILSRRNQSALPLEKPYYQHIIQQWQTRVVDADTHSERVESAVPKINLDDNLPKWALMLEGEWPDKSWHQHILGQQWLDKGTADSRDAVAALKQNLAQQPAQLLIGVRAQQVPDRGVLRQLLALAEAAQGGAVVQLLADKAVSDGLEDYLHQWHEALAERQLAWLDPPRISQAQRQQQEAIHEAV